MQITTTLAALARRAQEGKPDLTPAIAVLGDLTRVVMSGKAREIKDAQSAVATLRGKLDVGSLPAYPAQALRREYSHMYLAGAMWAVNEMMTARLDVLDRAVVEPGRRTRKASVEQAVLCALSANSGTSPKEVLATPAGQDLELRKDEVAKALSVLMSKQLVDTVEPAADSDRRARYYALSELGVAHLDACKGGLGDVVAAMGRGEKGVGDDVSTRA